MRTIKLDSFEVADCSTSELVAVLGEWACTTGQPRVSYALHVGGLNLRGDAEYVRSLAHADLVYADGVAAVMLAKIAGAERIQRSATTDIGVPVLAEAARLLGRPVRVALIGGPEGLAHRAARVLERRAPVSVVLAQDGFLKDWGEALLRLRDLTPDVLFVGMGAPVESLWVERHLSSITIPLIMTCGGWFGFLSGDERRASAWQQRAGLEWISRLRQDPRRLAPRYGRGALTVVALTISALRVRRRRKT